MPQSTVSRDDLLKKQAAINEMLAALDAAPAATDPAPAPAAPRSLLSIQTDLFRQIISRMGNHADLEALLKELQDQVVPEATPAS